MPRHQEVTHDVSSGFTNSLDSLRGKNACPLSKYEVGDPEKEIDAAYL